MNRTTTNGRNIGAATSRLRLVASAALIMLPLSGCMSAGMSSFSALEPPAKKQQSVMSEPLALDVATTGVVDETSSAAAGLNPASNQQVSAGALPGIEASAPPIAANSLAAEESRQVSALAPAINARGEAAPTELAALAPGTETEIDPATGLPIATLVDPAEVAAEMRAEQLYASMRHGKCKGEWGPKPKMINAKRIDPTHKYYMEMRLRHTPPLPVGHVFIAYGRIGPDGEPLDERMVMLAPVGGYAGATLAAAAPMPGVLEPYGDDCILKPIAAYRVSLTAQQYEKLLQRIVQAQQEKPRYALWTYNCNHFMSDVALSVGILPPENKYTPSLQYFYAMMDRNEGRKVDRSPDADTAQLAAN
jgi:hypothetical protein